MTSSVTKACKNSAFGSFLQVGSDLIVFRTATVVIEDASSRIRPRNIPDVFKVTPHMSMIPFSLLAKLLRLTR